MRPVPDPVGPGQESVWRYPRPPRVEPTPAHITVEFNGVVVADTRQALRVLETSHPPSYYLPLDAFRPGVLVPVAGSTWCEFKGHASYFDIRYAGRSASRCAWTYPRPTPGFEAIEGHVALMPAAMDVCSVDGEVARPQEGGFYGGWITSAVVGPFKGGPGTMGW